MCVCVCLFKDVWKNEASCVYMDTIETLITFASDLQGSEFLYLTPLQIPDQRVDLLQDLALR